MKKYPPIVQVDDSGNVIGPIAYKEAHSRGIRHAAVNLFIFSDFDYKNVLVSLRADGVVGAGKWDTSSGGHLDWLVEKAKSATVEETILKESQEELFAGVALPPSFQPEEVCRFLKNYNPLDLEYVTLFKTIFEGPFITNQEEVARVSFINIDQLRCGVNKNPSKYTQNVKVCLKQYLINQ